MCSCPFETRSLPGSLAATLRGFAFYVAFPESSIRRLGLPIYVARVPAGPLMRSLPRDLSVASRLDRHLVPAARFTAVTRVKERSGFPIANDLKK